MRITKQLLLIVSGFFLSCSSEKALHTFELENELDMVRSHETVQITKEFLNLKDVKQLTIKEKESGNILLTQCVDEDGDGVYDAILFQPSLSAKEKKEYQVVALAETTSAGENTCYSRFVPERTDDYTWENDLVAFRIFGPTAQKMSEDGVPGGTLSSGVDAWLKKVSYPIIDKWYDKTVNGNGSYHEDTGEGLDNFHVGVSRGVGGSAVKIEDTFYFSKNFETWRTITSGPIRTSFYVTYANWDANGNEITEAKIISLDLGNHLSRFEVNLSGSDHIAAGLTLHEKDGKVSSGNNWLSYWQPHGDSELGTAIVAADNYFNSYEEYNVETKDLSNAYAILNIESNTAVYYAGFGWKERGLFTTEAAWQNYLKEFGQKLNSPIKLVDLH